MSERRSSRSHGSVKYAGFDDGEESDDDFAVPSHPAKKQKSSKTVEAANKSQKSVKDGSMTLVKDVKKHVITSQTSTTRRAPLSEKVYERELQEALELSLFETGKSQNVVNHDLDNYKPQVSEALTSATDVLTNSGQLASSPGDICAEPHSLESSVHTATTVTCSSRLSHATVLVDDSIELVESENANSGNTQQAPTHRQACKKPRLVNRNDETDESDFNPDDDSDEDKSKGNTESEDDDETRSNTGRRCTQIKTVNPKRKNKSSAMASKISKSIQKGSVKGARKTFAKSQPPGPSDMATSSLCSSNPPPSMTKPSAVGSKSATAPKVCSQKLASSLISPWKPPARGSSEEVSAATVRSPSSGLRLGLSRNQRVKPLHPSVQVS
ncbi:unnamed protein product [Candidula unifasciata]|uniref:RAD51 interacting motif domain-containing protein n=1 Tax=Candidula unifasciata TaxID=100452 RepID=A0A8S3YNB1_9EUPU|nr:unnamed protein product [Candidula unifasciata]